MPTFLLYSLFAGLLVVLTVIALARVWLGRTLRPGPVAILTGVWLVALVYLTMRPASGMLRLNLVPVLVSGTGSPFDTLANIAVFVPLGLLLAAAGWEILPTVSLGLGISLAIEITQYLLDWGRTADINDLVTNTAGAALGWAIAAALRAGRRRTELRIARS